MGLKVLTIEGASGARAKLHVDGDPIQAMDLVVRLTARRLPEVTFRSYKRPEGFGIEERLNHVIPSHVSVRVEYDEGAVQQVESPCRRADGLRKVLCPEGVDLDEIVVAEDLRIAGGLIAFHVRRHGRDGARLGSWWALVAQVPGEEPRVLDITPGEDLPGYLAESL